MTFTKLKKRFYTITAGERRMGQGVRAGERERGGGRRREERGVFHSAPFWWRISTAYTTTATASRTHGLVHKHIHTHAQ